MTDESDAYLLGRLIGEETIEQEMSSVFAAERFQEVFEQVDARCGGDKETLKEYSRGFLLVQNHHQERNYTTIPEYGRIRAIRWLRGQKHPEDAPASILLEQTTVDQVHKIHGYLPAASLDTMILLALAFLVDQIETETGEQIGEYHSSVYREQLQDLVREASSGG